MEKSEKIMIVDDDPNILQVAGFAVQKAGYSVVSAKNGREALELFRGTRPDLIVLDIMMPELDGTELCKMIRLESDLPIIFLTSMDEEIDRVLGLELGADDYITKPISPRELVARIKTVLRRVAPRADRTEAAPRPVNVMQHGSLSLDRDCFRVLWGDSEVALTSTEFDILRTMLSYPGKVFSRAELVDRSYGGDTHVSDRTVDSHIRHIRDKFRSVGADPVETVHGVGYKLSGC